MKQRINIYIGDLALAELGRLANVRGLSRGKVVEELVLGAADTETRLAVLEKAISHPRLEESYEKAVASGEPEPGSEEVLYGQPDSQTVEPPKSGPKVKAMKGGDWGA